MLGSLALQSLLTRLPADASVILSAQATTYLSEFSTLTQAKVAYFICISHHISGTEAKELLELLAACLISTKTGRCESALRLQ